MDQISKTVNTFLSYIVGIGLICFFSFVFLLASAKLNNSTLGNLLASSAGETARMARSESFSFWGNVGQQVASGLGVSSAGGSVTANYPLITPVAGVTPIPASAAPATAVPVGAPPTAAPTTYVRSSPLSEGGLLRWQGLEADGKLSPGGVNMESVRDQAGLALQQNPGDMLALWLMSKWRTCQPYLNTMRANYADPAQVPTVRQGADDVLAKCNPRVTEAYARRRWADLVAWASQPTPDDATGAKLLQGLTLAVGAKIDGPAREARPQDHVPISFPPDQSYSFPGATFTVTVGLLDQALGQGKWNFLGGPYTASGAPLVPADLPMPVMPTDAELTPPLAAAGAASKSIQPTPPPTNPGKYTVQTGDTVYNIARKFGITPDVLIAANPNTLGFNPNYITPGMELNIPPATP
jgi:LysM repeat protein